MRSSFLVPSATLALLVACTDFKVQAGAPTEAGVDAPSISARDAAALPDSSIVEAHDAGVDSRTISPPANDGGSSGPHDSGSTTSGHDGGGGGGEGGGGEGGGDGEAGMDAGDELLMSGLRQATLVVVDDTNVYVSDPGTTAGNIYQCPKTGCTTPIPLGTGQATGLAVDSKNVYWSDFEGNRILSCAIGGCSGAPTVLAGNQMMAEGLSFDGTNLFWQAGGDVITCTAPTCPTKTTLATGQSPGVMQFVSTGIDVFWLGVGSLEVCGVAGCTGGPTALTTNTYGSNLAIATNTLYFVNEAAVDACFLSASSCTPRTVVASSAPYGIAVDGFDIYWLDDVTEGVFRCPTAGCGGSAPLFADEGQSADGASIALDADYVYWSTPTEVFRRHK